MSRTKIIGLVLALGLIILLFVFAESCHSGNEPPEIDENEIEEVNVEAQSPRHRYGLPQPTGLSAPVHPIA